MKKFFILFGMILSISYLSNSQSMEDGLRLMQSNSYISARAGGLGVSYYGISDDYSAMFFNPAGLSLVSRPEFTFGLGFTRNNTETSFINNKTEFNSNDAYITSAGMAIPFRTKIGNAAIGLGYALESNFDNNIKYNAYNTKSTMTGYYTNSATPSSDTNMIYDNLPGYLVLAGYNKDGNNKLYTLINNNLMQSAFVQEEGGIHDIAFSAAFDLNEYVSVGATIIGKFGNYKYIREFIESDINNYYTDKDTIYFYMPNYTDKSKLDFDRLTVDENIEQSISGISGSVGVQGRFKNFLRYGVTIKFPTYYSIDENWSQEASARFDDGYESTYPYQNKGENSYSITTPFIYSAGVSVNSYDLTISGGIEYTDASQLSFSKALKAMEKFNLSIVQQLVGQFTWSVGAEYMIPLTPLEIRASYSSTSSPYNENIDGADLSVIAFGAGIYLAPNIRLDGMFRTSKFSQIRTNYGLNTDADFYDETTGKSYLYTAKPWDVSLQLTYRINTGL